MKLISRLPIPCASFICLFGLAGFAPAQVLDAISDTILLNNGTPTSQGTADAEDNFGGRAELIIGNNGQNARGGLVRFDVSSLADMINDAGQVVSSAKLVLNTADARVDIQPETESIFDVYAVCRKTPVGSRGLSQAVGLAGVVSLSPRLSSTLLTQNSNRKML